MESKNSLFKACGVTTKISRPHLALVRAEGNKMSSLYELYRELSGHYSLSTMEDIADFSLLYGKNKFADGFMDYVGENVFFVRMPGKDYIVAMGLQWYGGYWDVWFGGEVERPLCFGQTVGYCRFHVPV